MRQVLHVSDIMEFFNKKERQSYKMIAAIKKHFNKETFQPVTISDFAVYYKISQESIVEVMKSNDLLKNHQSELIEQEKLEDAKTKKKIKEAKDLQILEKLERIENKPKQFSSKLS